jgi:hypothetical protein
VILPHPAGHERHQREPEEQVQVGPEDGSVDIPGGVQHVMVVVPVDPQEHEAQHVAEEHGQERLQGSEVGTVRDLQLQHHDRDENRDHAIAEGLQARLAHEKTATTGA